jgi:hypothetical protein
MMEKYDGVRVFWDGKRLHTSRGEVSIEVPKECVFPSTPFEGELWYIIVDTMTHYIIQDGI